MEYFRLFSDLKGKSAFEQDSIPLGEGIVLYNCSFLSANASILPGEPFYECPLDGFTSTNEQDFRNPLAVSDYLLDIHDSQVKENKQFRYHILARTTDRPITRFVLMFHGFNEKTWDKYLPWAMKIVEGTGKAVVLFPFAFHMNRAPLEWSDSRKMQKISEERRRTFPHLVSSTFSNVAISSRIHIQPQRFFWSGLQSYYDVIQLLDQIKSGNHALIIPDAEFDLFTYSIGGLLAQILMMTNHKDYFSSSKLCLFCGGAVFNRLSPVSRFILDSEANVALYSYIIEHLESHLKNDVRLRHYLAGVHPEGITFFSMLNYNLMRKERETILQKISHQVLAIPLEQDTVVPSYEVINTLQGSRRQIPIPVEVVDFPYPYHHENPFPADRRIAGEVTAAFNMVFERVSRFLG